MIKPAFLQYFLPLLSKIVYEYMFELFCKTFPKLGYHNFDLCWGQNLGEDAIDSRCPFDKFCRFCTILFDHPQNGENVTEPSKSPGVLPWGLPFTPCKWKREEGLRSLFVIGSLYHILCFLVAWRVLWSDGSEYKIELICLWSNYLSPRSKQKRKTKSPLKGSK